MKTIVLTKGFVALVDDADFDLLNQWKWTASVQPSTVYAYRKVPPFWKNNMRMHSFILGTEPGEPVDHIDHNGLNNQRHNLRRCVTTQNNGNSRIAKHNTSGLKGVRFCSGKWEAHISRKNKTYYLGRFTTSREAAIVYDAAAVDYFGAFALTNKQLGLYE